MRSNDLDLERDRGPVDDEVAHGSRLDIREGLEGGLDVLADSFAALQRLCILRVRRDGVVGVQGGQGVRAYASSVNLSHGDPSPQQDSWQLQLAQLYLRGFKLKDRLPAGRALAALVGTQRRRPGESHRKDIYGKAFSVHPGCTK